MPTALGMANGTLLFTPSSSPPFLSSGLNLSLSQQNNEATAFLTWPPRTGYFARLCFYHRFLMSFEVHLSCSPLGFEEATAYVGYLLGACERDPKWRFFSKPEIQSNYTEPQKTQEINGESSQGMRGNFLVSAPNFRHRFLASLNSQQFLAIWSLTTLLRLF